MRWLLTLILLAGTVVVHAADWKKTLPSDYYLKAERRGISSRWIAEGFQPSKGISWDGHIGWEAGDRHTAFSKALREGIQELCRAEGPYRLRITVVQCEQSPWVVGDYRIETQVLDASGQVVAMTHSYAMASRSEGPVAAVPALVNALDKDLFR